MDVSLASEIERWQYWASAGESLVILGIVIEAVELAFTLFSGENKKREHILVGLSIIILIAGLALESLASRNEHRLVARQTIMQQREIAAVNLQTAQVQKDAGIANKAAADAHERAGGATERAANAERQAAKAGVEAAMANERTEHLRLDAEAQREKAAKAELALLELQERMKDRHLTPGQRKTIADILASGPKGDIEIVFFGTGAEPRIFAQEFREILTESGWTVKQFFPELALGGRPPGLTIGLHDSVAAPLRAATLQKALKAAKLSAPAEVWGDVSEGSVWLFVGDKP